MEILAQPIHAREEIGRNSFIEQTEIECHECGQATNHCFKSKKPEVKRVYLELTPCICQDWVASMSQIEGAQSLAHSHGMPYTGAQFKYCPWCGLKRMGGS